MNTVSKAWDTIAKYSKKAGRSATSMALYFYYVMTQGDLTTADKTLLYAGIIYIIVPGDLIPRRLLGVLGLADDAAIAALVFNKIKNSITPEIETKVGETLDRWFGYEITTDVTD